MRLLNMTELRSAELNGPFQDEDGDLFRSETFDILLTEEEGFLTARLRAPDGAPVRVVDETGSEVDEEALSTLLWERLEVFDEVIERLAGPIPEL
jgi:hypothetical protein